MDMEHICMGCMSNKGASKECPVCGWIEGAVPESPQHLPPRTILNGRYMLGRVLGYGGFGITYLGWDINLNVKLAIKEFLPHDFATRTVQSKTVSVYSGESKSQFDYGLEKFIEEARMLAKFDDHPGIISVKDFFRENGTAYIVMNYLEGITLKEYLDQKGGILPFDVTLNIVMPVMDALREVHQTGMLHRDISPDNIYITRNGQVKLLDFGAARFAVGECSKSLSVVLKPGYAPEEQYRTRGKQGPWSDVYAVAGTIYRMITGQVPPESLDRIEEDILKSPSELGVEITDEAESALLKALSVRAAGRYQTMREFQDALTGNASEPEPYKPVVAAVQPEDIKTQAFAAPIPEEVQKNPTGTNESLEFNDVVCPACGSVNKLPAGVEHGQLACSYCRKRFGTSLSKLKPEEKASEKVIPRWVWGAAAGGVGLVVLVVGIIVLSNQFRNTSNPIANDSTGSINQQVTTQESSTASETKTTGDNGNQPKNDSGTSAQKVMNSNIANGGFAAVQGDSILYSNWKDGKKLYKISLDGSAKTKLNEEDTACINIAGEWCYYINNSEGGGIYKIKSDGSQKTKLADNASEIHVVDEWIYYLNTADDCKLYKIKLDGTDRMKLNDDKSSCIGISDGWIYYSNESESNKLYKIRTDGSGKTKLNDDISRYLSVSGEWIFYCNGNDDEKLFKIKNDGSSRTKLNDDTSAFTNISGDWIYYSNNDDEYKLYKVKADGSEREKLNDDMTTSINVTGDWIYYVLSSDDKLYRMKSDGSQRQVVE